ncbi:alpha/beta hydrolase [Gimesia panareensis]|uniref:Uncharacterized protein n=1 Tax=Gimesia panareensis TaxID=2527978 RepID=A0A518A727_9PLAN|nr:alpha/beta hydrolase [Gimesia panareensis]QDT26588.1 hypothetical protein Enr10x_18920 [Gimesia panareensis]QDU50533.1 hypothetical protein Pan110_28850 [Gimesia panareensis]
MNLLQTQSMHLKAGIFCFLLLFVSPAFGQGVPPAPGCDQEPGQCLNTPACTSCVPDINYWVVSSRCCPQKSNCCCPSCEFDVYHSAEAGQVTEQSMESMLQSLDPNAPICIMVHGSLVKWEDVLLDSYNTYLWLKAAAPQKPLNVIFFSWPSDDTPTKIIPVDVHILGKRAEFNGHYLAQLIAALPPHHQISLLGHSHGARLVASTMHLIGGGSIQGISLSDCGIHICCHCRHFRIVFAAAAFNHNWLNPGERYGCGLNCTDCLVNLRNHKDRVLLLYPVLAPASRRALARTGFTWMDRRKLGEDTNRVNDIDVSDCVGAGHMFPNYYSHPEIAETIVPAIYFSN